MQCNVIGIQSCQLNCISLSFLTLTSIYCSCLENMSNVRVNVGITLEQRKQKKNEGSKIRMRRYRNRIATEQVKTCKYKSKDAKRKRDKRELKKQTDDLATKKLKRDKERLRKQKQRQRKATAATAGLEEKVRSVVSSNIRIRKKSQRQRDVLLDEIGALNRLWKRKREKVDNVSDKAVEDDPAEENEEFEGENECGEEVQDVSCCSKSTPPKPSVARAIWETLSPNAKRKSTLQLKLNKPVSAYAVRKEIGINVSREISPRDSKKTELCEEVEKFFQQEDVTRLCPDKKKVVKDPINPDIQQQIRYRACSLKVLHAQFQAERSTDCSFPSFKRYVPYFVKRPSSPSEWGTCMCESCLNPELKYERLVQMKILSSDDFEILTSEERIGSFIEDVKKLKENKQYLKDKIKHVNFTEWRKVDNPYISKSGKKLNKITRNVADTLPLMSFLDVFIKELTMLKDHLFRVHQQYKAFKNARIEATNDSEGKTATIHLDWSENAKLIQARAAKSAHYNEDQISIQCMRLWNSETQSSVISISDITDHSAGAVWASLEPVLLQLTAKGVTKIYIVSDCPTSQFRNKSIFYLLRDFE